MKKSLSLFLVSGLLAFSSVTALAASLENNGSTANQAVNSMQIKWLGISLGEISPPLRSQLSKHIKDNEGVMIRNVQPRSPAQVAGLQAFDILKSFNGVAVNHPQQVYELVQKSDENKEIKLDIIRAGQQQTLNAKVGLRDINRSRPSPFQRWPHHNNQFGRFPGFNHPFFNSQPQFNSPFFQHNWPNSGSPNFNSPGFPAWPKNQPGNAQGWSQSESLSIKTLKDGKIHAELKSKDTNGDEKNFVFEGERDVIIKQIQEQKDLPEPQKNRLLGALQGNPTIIFNNNFFGSDRMPPFPSGPFAKPKKGSQPKNKSFY